MAIYQLLAILFVLIICYKDCTNKYYTIYNAHNEVELSDLSELREKIRTVRPIREHLTKEIQEVHDNIQPTELKPMDIV